MVSGYVHFKVLSLPVLVNTKGVKVLLVWLFKFSKEK